MHRFHRERVFERTFGIVKRSVFVGERKKVRVMLELLQRAGRPEDAPSLRPSTLAAWGWRRADLEARAGSLRWAVPPSLQREIALAMALVRANGLDLDTVEQEDMRLPSFAQAAPRLRALLDDGPGLAIVSGVDLDPYSDDEAGIIGWALSNYLGRPIRQGLKADRRLFTVTDRGAANRDPTRIGASNRISWMHTDNGCLEPRPPCYIGLLCVHAARRGGDSMIASAATLHDAMLAEHPDLLPELFRPFHFLPPHLHTWPAGPRTIVKPVFERRGEEIHIHYARVMIEPGMERAGTPLTARQREALDAFDGLMQRPDMHYVFRLARGEMLVTNNVQTIHGRAGYEDGETADERRMLKRLWMWRRDRGPGIDPVALDAAELGRGA
ncbi:MAG: TauD/TfdA family dioxygenase [Alphaproteobacteria bacterium]|nr:TauD/TfdA family dioxygenase [Alphaproteobacteria bacterium]